MQARTAPRLDERRKCGRALEGREELIAHLHRCQGDRGRQKLIIYAGAIALSKDRAAMHLNPDCGYGRVLNLAGED